MNQCTCTICGAIDEIEEIDAGSSERYELGLCRRCYDFEMNASTPRDFDNEEEPDDDPICVCGTHLSEHQLCGCERFQTPKAYEASKNAYEKLTEDERWALDEYEANGGTIY